MSWKIDFEQDTIQKGIGTARANYTDEATGLQFTSTARLDTNDRASIDAFVDKALAGVAKKTTDSTENLSVISKIENVLNSKVKVK